MRIDASKRADRGHTVTIPVRSGVIACSLGARPPRVAVAIAADRPLPHCARIATRVARESGARALGPRIESRACGPGRLRGDDVTAQDDRELGGGRGALLLLTVRRP